MSERWWHEAACHGMDQAIFFPARGESVGPARLVCQGCPVRAECPDDALADGAFIDGFNGVRGGLSTRERRNLRASGAPMPAMRERIELLDSSRWRLSGRRVAS